MRICVYCSSSTKVGEHYVAAAKEFGRLLGERGHALIYGGANLGLMGHLACAAQAAGAHVTGVIPERLQSYGLVLETADEIIITETMGERKAVMENAAEAFCALPGGIGTLEELLEVMTLKQLGYLHGPIVLLNTLGFYDLFLAHLERLYQQNFAKIVSRQLYHVAETPLEAIKHMENCSDEDLPEKWFDLEG